MNRLKAVLQDEFREEFFKGFQRGLSDPLKDMAAANPALSHLYARLSVELASALVQAKKMGILDYQTYSRLMGEVRMAGGSAADALGKPPPGAQELEQALKAQGGAGEDVLQQIGRYQKQQTVFANKKATVIDLQQVLTDIGQISDPEEKSKAIKEMAELAVHRGNVRQDLGDDFATSVKTRDGALKMYSTFASIETDDAKGLCREMLAIMLSDSGSIMQDQIQAKTSEVDSQVLSKGNFVKIGGVRYQIDKITKEADGTALLEFADRGPKKLEKGEMILRVEMNKYERDTQVVDQ